MEGLLQRRLTDQMEGLATTQPCGLHRSRPSPTLAAGPLQQGNNANDSFRRKSPPFYAIRSHFRVNSRRPYCIKKPLLTQRSLALLPCCGERGIRTPGTVIPYDSLANCWFKPLTHLSVLDLKSRAKISSFWLTTNLFEKKIYTATFFIDNSIQMHGYCRSFWHNYPSECIFLLHIVVS